MKMNQLNEYTQTVAAVFAIAGILLLGFELRQSNRIAVSEGTSANWSHWINTSTALIESDIAFVRAKSMKQPNELTLEEKIDMDWYLQSWVYRYSHDISTIDLLGIDSEVAVAELMAEVVQEVPRIFGSRWSRAWLEENQYWIPSPIREAIQRGLRGAPIGSDLDYYNRIDALAAAMN